MGGWSPSAVWLPGDFNGDGRTDVAGIWNDGGMVTIAVYLSDGKKFLPPAAWSARDGRWGDANLNTLTVRQSNGRSFVPAHWAIRAGGWRNSAAWCSGQFTAITAVEKAAKLRSGIRVPAVK